MDHKPCRADQARRADRVHHRIARVTETALAIEARSREGPVPRSSAKVRLPTHQAPMRQQIRLARVARILRRNRTDAFGVRTSVRMCSTQPRSDDPTHPFRLLLESQRLVKFRLVVGDEIDMLPIQFFQQHLHHLRRDPLSAII